MPVTGGLVMSIYCPVTFSLRPKMTRFKTIGGDDNVHNPIRVYCVSDRAIGR